MLKDNCSAYLFETHRDYDKDEFLRNMKQNLQGENLLMKMLSPSFLKKQLSMTYSTSEFGGIIAGSKFNKKYEIENVELGNLPVWLRIKLTNNG